MEKYILVLLVFGITLGAGFYFGIEWKNYWYVDQCIEAGGHMRAGGMYPVCVVGGE